MHACQASHRTRSAQQRACCCFNFLHDFFFHVSPIFWENTSKTDALNIKIRPLVWHHPPILIIIQKNVNVIIFPKNMCRKGRIRKEHQGNKTGEKKGKPRSCPFFVHFGCSWLAMKTIFFWKRTRLIYCPDERTSFSPRQHIPLMFHLDVLKSWLPRVTVGVPSVMTVVRLISCSRIRCISASTKLIDGRCSLIGLTHHDVKRSSSFMLSEVKPLAILLSTITEISLDSWKFCTCISIDA